MEQMKRNSNFELLRLISMYMIVFIHANMYLPYFCEGKARFFFNGLVNGICNIGVTCFVLISGYFGLRFNLKKLLKMECMMISFSVIETIILYILMPQEMQGAALLEQIVKTCFPIITRKYWFYSCYVCLFCLSGYINKFIELLKQDEFRKLLSILLLLFSVFPTIFYFEIIPDNGKGLVQMMLIYMLGRYLQKYGLKILSKGKAIALFCGLWLINGISHEIPIRLGGIYHHLCKDNSITNIVMAVILFGFVKEWAIQSEIVNRLSKNVFAVFALNNSMVSVAMYLLINSGKLQTGGITGFVLLVMVVGLVMLGCILIGSIRELLIGKIENSTIYKISQIASRCGNIG